VQAAQIVHIDDWARVNNLWLNRTKSAEIVFVSSRSRRIPLPAFPGFTGVELIKILGVPTSRRFSVALHVDALLAGCAQTSFALRGLRPQGVPTSALHAVFQATVAAKMTYTASAWWAFAIATDSGRLVAFLRRSVMFG
jgi:hypothetical protein